MSESNRQNGSESTERTFRGVNLFGMDVINADCKAIAEVLIAAEEMDPPSERLGRLAERMALVKIAQELSGVAYQARTRGTTTGARPKGSSALDALKARAAAAAAKQEPEQDGSGL